MAKGTKYTQQFKEDAVQYRLDHPELSLRKSAENLGISESALKSWMKASKEHEGTVPARETSSFCQRNTEKIRRFTFWLQCIEETD